MGGKSVNETPGIPSNSGFPGQPGQYTMPAAPPGMTEALAAQMQQAYGGDQAAFLAKLYQPQTFPSYQPLPGFAATAVLPSPVNTTPTTPAVDTGGFVPEPYDVSRQFHPNWNRRT